MFKTVYSKKIKRYVLYFLGCYVGNYDSLEEVDKAKAEIL